MVCIEHRKSMILILEHYFDGRINEDELLTQIYDSFDIEDIDDELTDETVLAVIGEITDSLTNPAHFLYNALKERYDYWQRLLLVLKSGAVLEREFSESPAGFDPFRCFADIRKAYVLSRGFKKKSYNKIEVKPLLSKIDFTYFDKSKQIVIVCILTAFTILTPFTFFGLALLLVIMLLINNDHKQKLAFYNKKYIAVLPELK
jgi:hypothetical protein